jgi:predicted ArsR family transcriptional regulator
MGKQEALNLLKAARRPLTLKEVYILLGTSRQSASKSLNRLRHDGDIEVTSFKTKHEGRGGSKFLYALKADKR